MEDLEKNVSELNKTISDLIDSIKRFDIAIVRLHSLYSPKQRLPRKLKKRIKKEAERAVFELQFEVF